MLETVEADVRQRQKRNHGTGGQHESSMARIDSYPVFFVGLEHQKRQKPKKGRRTVEQVYQPQEKLDFDEAVEYRLQENPKEAEVPNRSLVPMHTSLHELLLQNWTKKSLRQKRCQKVLLRRLQEKETMR